MNVAREAERPSAPRMFRASDVYEMATVAVSAMRPCIAVCADVYAFARKVPMSTHPMIPDFATFSGGVFQNPFATTEPIAQEPVDANETSYVMIQNGPRVDDAEVESDADAVEVMIMWGTSVLHVDHLSPVRSFTIGEGACDFLVPSERLGAMVASVVEVRDGVPFCVVPTGATATIETRDAKHEVQGPTSFALSGGMKTQIAIGDSGIVVKLAAVRAGKRFAGGTMASILAAMNKYIGVSMIAHLGAIAALAFFVPKMSGDDAESIDRDRIILMQKMLNASAQREEERREEQTNAGDTQPTGGTGEQAKGAEGKLGSTVAPKRDARYEVQGPKDNADPQLRRKQEIEFAKTEGFIGILNAGAMNKDEPASPWGADNAQGKDADSKMGNMWGATLDDALGMGGLGLLGTDEGGGGKGAGIGLDKIGGLGNGAGGGPGQGIGPGGTGIGHSPLKGGYVPHQHGLREAGPTTTNGRLPAEVIQRVVRQNFGRFRSCYETGLRTNPTLAGRVAVNFVIGRDGSVAVAQDAGSDLPDHAVVQCVVRGYQGLTFPQPDNGVVTVTYPLVFSAAE